MRLRMPFAYDGTNKALRLQFPLCLVHHNPSSTIYQLMGSVIMMLPTFGIPLVLIWVPWSYQVQVFWQAGFYSCLTVLFFYLTGGITGFFSYYTAISAILFTSIFATPTTIIWCLQYSSKNPAPRYIPITGTYGFAYLTRMIISNILPSKEHYRKFHGESTVSRGFAQGICWITMRACPVLLIWIGEIPSVQKWDPAAKAFASVVALLVFSTASILLKFDTYVILRSKGWIAVWREFLRQSPIRFIGFLSTQIPAQKARLRVIRGHQF
jgi:hypothetical protein